MKKLLKIEIMEVVDISEFNKERIYDSLSISEFNKERIYDSLASSCLHDCDMETCFILDGDNYEAFINYFSIELDNNQIEEILNYFK